MRSAIRQWLTGIWSRRQNHWILKLFIGGLFGIAAGFTFFTTIQKLDLSRWIKIGLLGGIFLFTTVFASWGIFHFAFPLFNKKGYSQIQSAAILIGMIIAGMYLVLVFPIIPTIRSNQTLEIIATGKKNPKALGNEVRLEGFYRFDGNRVDLGEFKRINKRWVKLDDQLIASQKFPAKLSWGSSWLFPSKLVFISHPWSGIVKVFWNGEVHTLDLYSASGRVKELPFTPQFPILYQEAFWLSSGSLLGLILFLVAAGLISRKAPSSIPSRTNSRWVVLVYALPMIGIWLMYWLAFYPGLMTSDSRGQLRQITSGIINDAHPAFHTWTLWLITRLWNSPAAVSLVQILVLACVAGYGYYQMRRYGTPKLGLWIGLGVFSLSIINGLMVVTLWKDILFSAAFLLFFIIWTDIIITKGANLAKTSSWLIFILASMLTVLYRHNGFLVIIFSLAFLAIFIREVRKKAIISIVTIFFISTLIKGPVFDLMNVQRVDSYFEVAYELFHLGAHVAAGEHFSEAERKYLNEIKPLETQWDYTCYSLVPMFYSKDLNLKIVYDNPIRLRELFIRTLLRAPGVNLKHLVCSSSLVWRISNTPLFNISALTNDTNLMESKIPAWAKRIQQFYASSIVSDGIWLIWRPAFYLYLFLFGVLIKSLRSDRRFLMLAVPVLGICLSFIAVNGSQDFRYMYPVYVISLFSWPFLFIKPSTSRSTVSLDDKELSLRLCKFATSRTIKNKYFFRDDP